MMESLINLVKQPDLKKDDEESNLIHLVNRHK